MCVEKSQQIDEIPINISVQIEFRRGKILLFFSCSVHIISFEILSRLPHQVNSTFFGICLIFHSGCVMCLTNSSMDSNFDKMRSDAGTCGYIQTFMCASFRRPPIVCSWNVRKFASENCFSENLSPNFQMILIIIRELPNSGFTRPKTIATKTRAAYSTSESSKYVQWTKMDYDFGLLKSRMAECRTTTRTLTFS